MKIAFEKKFLADVAGADVEGVGDGVGVDVAAVGFDVGGLLDAGDGEAPDVNPHAVPVGGDVERDGAVGTLGDTLASGG